MSPVITEDDGMSSTDSVRPSGLARISEEFDAFVNTSITSLEQYEQAQRRSEEIKRELEPLMKQERGYKIAAKKATGLAAGIRERINELTAEKQEHDYLIRETVRSPFSPLKAYFNGERRNPGGRQH